MVNIRKPESDLWESADRKRQMYGRKTQHAKAWRAG